MGRALRAGISLSLVFNDLRANSGRVGVILDALATPLVFVGKLLIL